RVDKADTRGFDLGRGPVPDHRHRAGEEEKISAFHSFASPARFSFDAEVLQVQQGQVALFRDAGSCCRISRPWSQAAMSTLVSGVLDLNVTKCAECEARHTFEMFLRIRPSRRQPRPVRRKRLLVRKDFAVVTAGQADHFSHPYNVPVSGVPAKVSS